MKHYAYQSLLEANVYNISEPYDGVSIKSYLSQTCANLTDETVKSMIIKKLATLIVNDDDMLSPMRAIPDGAPDWAKKAFGVGDIMVFIPTPQIQDRISHIIDYVSALITDSKSPDLDNSAVAKRELSGLPKVGSIDVLYQKSNEYFMRGSNVKQSIDGMKVGKKVSNGYCWYLLVDQSAYEREGKILQNCIGRNYTASDAASTNTKIFILKDSRLNTVVGMRISDNNIVEVKGKNNKPPLPRYMPAVSEFFAGGTKYKWASGGRADIIASGYYIMDDNSIVTISDAIQTLMSPKEMGVINHDGHPTPVMKITIPDMTNDILEPIAKKVGLQAYQCIGKDFYMLGPSINDSVAWCLMQSTTLYSILPDSQETSSPARVLLSWIASNAGISRVEDSVSYRLLAVDGCYIDKHTGTIQEMKAAEQHTLSSNSLVTRYVGKAADAVTDVLGSKITSNDVIIIQSPLSHDVSVRTRLRGSPPIVLIGTDNGQHIPMIMDQYFSTHKLAGIISPNRRLDVLEASNCTNIKLPVFYCAGYGATHDADKGYHTLHPNIHQVGPTTSISLSNMSPVNRFIAICSSLGLQASEQHGFMCTHPLPILWWASYARATNMSAKNKDISNALNFITSKATYKINSYPNDRDVATQWKSHASTLFGGNIPDTIIISQASDKYIWLGISDNVVHRVFFSILPLSAKSGSVRKQYEQAASDLNNIITANNLTITPESVSQYSGFCIDRNTVTTVSSKVVASAANNASAGSVTLSGGWIGRPMSPETFNAWQRETAESSISGKIPYELIRDDKPVCAILVKGSSIAATYVLDDRPPDYVGHVRIGANLPIAKKNFPTTCYKQVKEFATKQKLKLPKTAEITADNKPGRFLIATSKLTEPTTRGEIMTSVGVSQTTAPGFDAPTNNLDAGLVALGLISLTRKGNKLMMSITPKGKEIADKLEGGASMSLYDIDSTSVKESFMQYLIHKAIRL